MLKPFDPFTQADKLTRQAPSRSVAKTRAALDLESYGWKVWLKEMGPSTFRGDFAPFHEDYWSWIWPLLRAKQRGESIAGLDQYLSYLLLLGRGMAKSSTMEWTAIAAGALIGQMAVVYTSSTEGLASEHLTAIQHRVESPQFERMYPTLSEARVGKYGSRAGWNKNILKTKSGLTIYAVGLNQDVRGLKDLDLRIGLEIFDDFDSRDDSPDVVAKKEGQIGGTILPMGTPETINVMGQNIIHENSVANRTHLRHNGLLSHRKESGVIPAFAHVEIEQQGDRHMITSGTPNWKYFDMLAAQKFLDDSGPLHWYAEYQHDFAMQREGNVLSNYNDDIIPITWEQFAAVYGVDRIPDAWNKYLANDDARTKSAYHCNVVSKLAVSDQNTALPGHIFFFDGLSFETGLEPDDIALRILESLSPFVPSVKGSPSGTTWKELIESTLRREQLERFTTSTTELIQRRHALLARVIPDYARQILKQQNYRALRQSHEALARREIYRTVFGLDFEPINPGKDGGIDMMNYLMKPDMTKEDPFRPGQMGYTRYHIITKQSERAFTGELKPENIHGMMLARYQFQKWIWQAPKLTAAGMEEKGPMKMNDDFGNSQMFIFHDNLPRARELTYAEKLQEAIPVAYRKETLIASNPFNGMTPEQEMAYHYQQGEAKKKLAGGSVRRFQINYNG